MEEFEKLLEKIKAYSPRANLEIVKKAFDFAAQAHLGHRRLSGEPYIIHPLAVALILADLEQDHLTISAALLHDVIEDAEVDLETLGKMFGKEVARLVEGVTKLSQLTFISREARQAENFRKMFLAMGEDFRVIIIKLADRLHNMQTLKYLPAEKQKETALETQEIFAPLAHRLGMWKLKWELEDLSFSNLESDKYEDIKNKVAVSRRERERYIQDFISQASGLLEKVGIEGKITGRPKHFYSIYRKMVDQNLEFDEIYDLTAVRIIVESVKDCYAVLGIVHAAWKPIPGRFRDYIAMPKSNGYQSLHTTLIGPAGRPVEIQIRTQQMHRIAEYGIAAHWRYKEGKTDQGLDQKMAWLREMLEWQNELRDAKDFMESLKIGLVSDEAFVFTPKGDVFSLPIDSTPVDFAYRVHTEVGNRTIGAKVNGRIVALDHNLVNGDIVEILTGKKDNPNQDWLRFVKTAGARVKIRHWVKKHRPELPPEPAVRKPQEAGKSKKMLSPLRLRPRTAIKVSGLENVLVRFSKCCAPIPPEPVVGFVTKGRGVAIHRQNCQNLMRQKALAEKVVPVEWSITDAMFFPAEIEIEVFDRVGVIKDVLEKIAETGTNVSAAKVKTKRGSTAFLKLTVDVQNVTHLERVVAAIRTLSEVYSVRR